MDTTKAFDKIQYSLVIKPLRKLNIGHMQNQTNPVIDITLNGERNAHYSQLSHSIL